MTDTARGLPLDELQRSYDETPYHDQHYPLFELERLLGLSQLFGLKPPEATTNGLRVLDLGCAAAVHLREQARRHPEATFTGVDFAPSEIELGRKALAEAGLQNVELVASDLREFDVEAGSYDFVVCHGVFSWVPDDVKERILLLARQALAPGGIAAVAYLTYPGWKQREAVRELLAMRDRPERAPAERVREASLLLRFLHAGYRSRPEDPHAAGLQAVVESMQSTPDNAFLHDELGAIHDPCYFLQFVEWARECGLQYLVEADLGSMSADGLEPAASDLLGLLGPDALETQQLVDFVVNRSGRSSLLVRSDAEPERSIQMPRLERLRYTSQWWNVTPLNAPEDAPARFESPTGRKLETSDPVVRSLLSLLTTEPRTPRSFRALLSSVDGKGPCEEDVGKTVSGLLAKGVIEPRAALGTRTS
jgi:SAM-dependent methyltransferase